VVLAGARLTWGFQGRSATRWTTPCWAWRVPAMLSDVAVLARTREGLALLYADFDAAVLSAALRIIRTVRLGVGR